MPSRSISRLALKAMAVRLFIVVLLSSIGGYWYNYQILKNNIIEDLEEYSDERSDRESMRFRFAEKNLALLTSAFVQRIESSYYQTENEFQNRFIRSDDGRYYHFKNTDHYQTQLLIQKDVPITNEIKRNLVVADHLLNNFGYAWSSMYLNVWMVSEKGYTALFWPSNPDLLEKMPLDYKFSEQPWITQALPQNNPEKKTKWSDPYLDRLTGKWIITGTHPVYLNHEYQFSLAIDFQVSALHERTMKNALPNTYHYIFTNSGQIVVEPDKTPHSKQTLRKIIHLVKESNGNVVHDKEDAFILVKRKIKTPDWWFVVIYPKINLAAVAKNTGIFVGLIGLISLMIELLMLHLVLRKYVARPIRKLIDATSRIAQGDTKARVEIDSQDEIGSLASSFNVMGDKIMERDHKLTNQADFLEAQVKERTSELDFQRAKAFQAAKMATLGEMAGGIAHEINNPLAIISMSTESLTKQIKSKSITDEKLLAYTDRIQKTTDRISKVVKGMKSFSRDAGNDPKKSVPIERVIQNTLNLCEQTLESNDIYLVVNDIPKVQIYCREIEIVQALMNLIQNSVDALAALEQKLIKIKTQVSETRVQIIVEDNGPRIPDIIADRLMTPFFTTKEIGKGVGLGLFTANGLVKSNGGNLFLDRNSPTTRFVIELPKEIMH